MTKEKELNIKAKLLSLFGKILYLASYTLVFVSMTFLFESFHVDREHLFLYSFISVIIIYVLNKTIKPILVRLTLPITGITMGLFYFFNNVIILKFVDFLMGDKVAFNNILVLFFISILMSLSNLLIDDLIIKPLLKEVKKNE